MLQAESTLKFPLQILSAMRGPDRIYSRVRVLPGRGVKALPANSESGGASC